MKERLKEITEWGMSVDIGLESIVELLKKDAARVVGNNKICEIRISTYLLKIAWYRKDTFDELPLLPPDKNRYWGATEEYVEYNTKKIRSRELILYERFITEVK